MHPGHSQGSPANAPPASFPRVLIATTAMLSFISFWRAAAIVLNDLASSAYYAGGIAEKAIGKAAPWFILAIMQSHCCRLPMARSARGTTDLAPLRNADLSG